jgi:hypothetical protein
MSQTSIVQFVSFETILDREKFIPQWELFNRSAKTVLRVTLQQSEKKGGFQYMAQHRYAEGEFQFVFEKRAKSSRTPEVEIKARQAGGYAILQLERNIDTYEDENKVFVFISDPQTDLQPYRELSNNKNLNIYEAFYENCQHAYILEYFITHKDEAAFLEKLRLYCPNKFEVYKDCMLEEA